MKTKIKRLLLILIGLCFLGLGVAIDTAANLGTDCMAGFLEIFSEYFSFISFGQMTTIVELLMIVFSYFVYKKTIGIGTIMTMLLVQFPIDLVYNHVPNSDYLALKLLYVLIGIILIALGAETIIHAGLGMGPYEAFMHSLSHKTKIKFTYVKYICDAIFLVLTILLKGKIGIGTILTYILTPFFMEFFAKNIKKIIKFE